VLLAHVEAQPEPIAQLRPNVPPEVIQIMA
jgi:hypothetical protein